MTVRLSPSDRAEIARSVRGGDDPAEVAARFGCSPSYAERLAKGPIRGQREAPTQDPPPPPPVPAIVVRIATSGEDVCWYGGGDGTPACTDTAVWWRADTRRGEHRPERLRTCPEHAHTDLPPLRPAASDGWLIAKVAAGQSTGEEVTLRDLDEHGQALAREALREGRLVQVQGRLRLAGPPIPTTTKRPDLALLRPSRLPTARPTPTPRMRLRAVDDEPAPARPTPKPKESPCPPTPKPSETPSPTTSTTRTAAPATTAAATAADTSAPTSTTTTPSTSPTGGSSTAPAAEAPALPRTASSGEPIEPPPAEPEPVALAEPEHTDTDVSPAPAAPPTLEHPVSTPKPRRPLGGRHNPITDREILDGLARHPDGAGPRALADTIERCHTSLRLPLRRLIKAGKVERTGGRNGPTVRYHLAVGRPTKAKPDAAIREIAGLARESVPAPAPEPTAPRTTGIPVHVLQDRRDRLVSKLGRARLRVLEVEGQLAAITDELARVSA